MAASESISSTGRANNGQGSSTGKELLVYDFDNTVNTNGNDIHLEAYKHATAIRAVPLTVRDFYRRVSTLWGATHTIINHDLCQEQPEILPEVNARWMTYMRQNYPERVQPVLGSVEMLGRLAERGYRQAIATATEPSLVEPVLEKFGIGPEVVHQVVTAYDVDSRFKPHPYHLQKIMRDQDVGPEKTLVIGDSVSDIVMAFRAGVDIAVVQTGDLSDEHTDLYEIESDKVLKDVTHLEAYLGRLSLKEASEIR